MISRQAGGDIEAEHRFRIVVEAAYHRVERISQRSAQARAEQCVHQHVAVPLRFRRVARDLHAGFFGQRHCVYGVACYRRRPNLHQLNANAGLLCKCCDNVAITGIVALAAKDGDPTEMRPTV